MFRGFLEAASIAIPLPGVITSSELVTAPPLLQHGDRQVSFGTLNTLEFEGVHGPVPSTSINIFIQLDRAIVFVNPPPDFHDSLRLEEHSGSRHEGCDAFVERRVASEQLKKLSASS